MYCASYKQSVGVGVVVNRSEGVGASVSVCVGEIGGGRGEKGRQANYPKIFRSLANGGNSLFDQSLDPPTGPARIRTQSIKNKYMHNDQQ